MTMITVAIFPARAGPGRSFRAGRRNGLFENRLDPAGIDLNRPDFLGKFESVVKPGLPFLNDFIKNEEGFWISLISIMVSSPPTESNTDTAALLAS